MSKDYYKVLGVPRNATKDEIKKAYRVMAHKHHPDKGGDEARFKEVNEAYQVLADDRKRSQYDQFGRVFEGAGPQQGGFGFEWPGGIRFDFGEGASGEGRGFGDFDFSDIFEDFLGGGMGTASRGRTRERKGKDMKLALDITFEESILGGKEEVQFDRLMRCDRCQGAGGEPDTKFKNCQTCQGKGNIQKTQRTFLGSFTQVATCHECLGGGKRPENPCISCSGRGVRVAQERLEIFIPKSVQDGEILKITGKGEASLSGGIPGDLYIKLHVPAHKLFRRQGDDIIMQLPIKISQAILGDTVEIEAFDGLLKIKIPEGTQSGDVLRVRGKGAYMSSSYGRGDLMVQIKVEIPRRAARKAREIGEKLKEEGF